ncbi:unnamed protein product [Aphanomyces euteiches]
MPWPVLYFALDPLQSMVSRCDGLFFVGSMVSIDILDGALNGFFLGMQEEYAITVQVLGMAVMGLSAALAGPFIERRGPRLSMAISTALVVLGWIFAELGVVFQVYPLLFIGYTAALSDILISLLYGRIGVFVAVGSGITMIVSVSTVQKWFPDLRGVSGITVAGMGGGSLVWINIYGALMHRKSDNIFM